MLRISVHNLTLNNLPTIIGQIPKINTFKTIEL